MATYRGGKPKDSNVGLWLIVVLITAFVVYAYVAVPIMKEKKSEAEKRQTLVQKKKILKANVDLSKKLDLAAIHFMLRDIDDPEAVTTSGSLPGQIARLEPKEWVCDKISAKGKNSLDSAYLCLKYHQQKTNFEDIYISFPQVAMVSGLMGPEKSGFIPYEAQVFFYKSPYNNYASYGNLIPMALKLTYIHDQLVGDDADDHVRFLNMTYAFDFNWDDTQFEDIGKIVTAPRWMMKSSTKKPITIKYSRPTKKDAIPTRVVILPSGVVARISYNDEKTWELFTKRVHKPSAKQAHNVIFKRDCGSKPSLNDENLSSEDLRDWAMCDAYRHTIIVAEQEDKNFHGIFGDDCGKHPDDSATKEEIEAWDICANYAFD